MAPFRARTEVMVFVVVEPNAIVAPAFWSKRIHSELSAALKIYRELLVTVNMALSGKFDWPQRSLVVSLVAAFTPVQAFAVASIVSLYQLELLARSSDVQRPPSRSEAVS